MNDIEILPEPETPYVPDPFNRFNDRAVINLVPVSVQNAFLEAFKSRPDFFGLDERTLWLKMKKEKCLPTVTDNRIRVKFWHEYDCAQERGTGMNLNTALARICSSMYFYDRYLTRPEKVAWILTMPVAYENKMEEMLEFGLEQFREILALDHGGTEENPRINLKLIEMKAKIIAMVDQRMKGGIVQRVEQKNMNLSIHTTDKGLAQKALGGTMKEIEERIKLLERKDVSGEAGIRQESSEPQGPNSNL